MPTRNHRERHLPAIGAVPDRHPSRIAKVVDALVDNSMGRVDSSGHE